MTDTSRDWRRIILLIYALAVFALMLWTGEPGKMQWWPVALGFVLFASLPVAVLCIGHKQVWLKTLGAAAMAAGGLWAYYDAMTDPEAGSTTALIFVVLPFYQLLAAAAFLLLLWLVHRFGGDEGKDGET